MAFSPNKIIHKGIELLYKKDTILFCPLCHVFHYRVLRDIYKRDQITASQVESLSDDVINPAITVSQRCQFCMGGGAVPLIEHVPGMALKFKPETAEEQDDFLDQHEVKK